MVVVPSGAIERLEGNGCDGVGDVDGGQAGAIIERFIADGCDGVGDVDGGQVGAIIERTFADGCDGVGDGRVHATSN